MIVVDYQPVKGCIDRRQVGRILRLQGYLQLLEQSDPFVYRQRGLLAEGAYQPLSLKNGALLPARRLLDKRRAYRTAQRSIDFALFKGQRPFAGRPHR